MGVGVAGTCDRHEQAAPGVDWQVIGVCGRVAMRAASERLVEASLVPGEQQPQTTVHAIGLDVIIEQAEASLANDVARIAARAISGRQSWRRVVGIGFACGTSKTKVKGCRPVVEVYAPNPFESRRTHHSPPLIRSASIRSGVMLMFI